MKYMLDYTVNAVLVDSLNTNSESEARRFVSKYLKASWNSIAHFVGMQSEAKSHPARVSDRTWKAGFEEKRHRISLFLGEEDPEGMQLLANRNRSAIEGRR